MEQRQNFNTYSKAPRTLTMSSSAQNTRQPRSAKACDACGRRKIRCDNAEPVCSPCLDAGLGVGDCTYSRVERKRGPPKGRPSALVSRIKMLETLLLGVQDGTVELPGTGTGAGTGLTGLNLGVASNAFQQPRSSATTAGGPIRVRSSSNAGSTLSTRRTSTGAPAAGATSHTGLRQPGLGNLALAQLALAQTPDPNSLPQLDFDLLQSLLSAAPAALVTAGIVPAVPTMTTTTTETQASFVIPSPTVLAMNNNMSNNNNNNMGFNFAMPTPQYTVDGGMSLFDLSPRGGGGGGDSSSSGSFGVAAADDPSSLDFSSFAGGQQQQQQTVASATTSAIARSDSGPTPSPTAGSAGGSFSFSSSVTPTPVPINLVSGPESALPDIISTYFNTFYYWIPILHPPTFRAKAVDQIDPFLLYSMAALACRFVVHPALTDVKASKTYFFEKAKGLMYPTLERGGSLTTIQALIHLIMYCILEAEPANREWLYSGICFRLAQDIQLNVDPNHRSFSFHKDEMMSWVEKEERRRAFWVCYVIDRQNAFIFDRSTMLQDDEIQVALPCEELVWMLSPTENGPQPGLSISSEAFPNLPPIIVDQDLSKLNTPAEVALQWISGTHAERLGPSGKPEFPARVEVFGAICMASQVLARVLAFHRRCSSRGTSPFAPENAAELHALEEALDDWYEAMPVDFTIVAREPDPDNIWFTRHFVAFAGNAPNGRPYTGLFTTHMLFYYHSIATLLHRPRVMSAMARDQEWISGPHFLKCLAQAESVLKIVNLLLRPARTEEEKDIAVHAHFFMCGAVFQCGLLQLLSLNSTAVVPPTSTADDPTIQILAAKAISALESVIQLLETYGTVWPIGEKLGMLLRWMAGDTEVKKMATAEDIDLLETRAVGLGLGKDMLEVMKEGDVGKGGA